MAEKESGLGKVVDLSDVINEIRKELIESSQAAAQSELQFALEGVELELQVGVTKKVEGKGGIKFWVLELGGGGGFESQSLQKIKIKLGPAGDAPVLLAEPLE